MRFVACTLIAFLSLFALQASDIAYFEENEPQVLRYWETLTHEERLIFEKQLSQINRELLEQLTL